MFFHRKKATATPSDNHSHHSLINPKVLFVYSILLILFQSITIYLNNGNSSTALAATSISSQEIINLTNTERGKKGLKQLKENAFLKQAAYEKGLDMFSHQYWSHVAPDGTTPWDFILQTGYDYSYAGENLAKDFTTAEGAVNAWMHSPTHRDNIVNTDFEDIGVAVVTGVFRGSETTICVQMFGTLSQTTNSVVAGEITNNLTQAAPAENSIISSEPPLILKPQNRSVINSTEPEIEGLGQAQTNILLYDQTELLGQVPVDGQNAFSFRPSESLAQGGHVFSAIATDNEGHKTLPSTPVSVVIDTVAPFIDQPSVNIKPFWTFKQRMIQVDAVVLGDPEQVIAAIGDFTFILNPQGKGYYKGLMTVNELNINKDTIKITAKDQAGNFSEVKISLPPFPPLSSQTLTSGFLSDLNGRLGSLLGRFRAQSFQETVRFLYLIFGIGLIGLFGIDALNVSSAESRSKSSSSLAHAVFIGLSLLGILFGSFGVIL